MSKYMVVCREGSDLDKLRQLAAVEWEDRDSGIAIVFCTKSRAEHLKSLPFVDNIEEPVMGTILSNR